MTVTSSEAAAHLRNLGNRLNQQYINQGLNVNVMHSTHITWQAPPFSVTEYLHWWNNFASRVERIPIDRMTDELQVIFQQIPAKVLATEPCIANMSNDYNAPFRALGMIKTWIEDAMPTDPLHVDWEDVKDKNLIPKALTLRLRSIDSRLKRLEPDTQNLQNKIDIINGAHDAAVALPTDMEELLEAKSEIEAAANETKRMEGLAAAHLSEVAELLEKIRRQETEAIKIIDQCEKAFGIATTVGLAGSFTSRARWITVASWVWVVGLIGALFAAFYVGTSRFEQLQKAISNNTNSSVMWLYLAMTILGVGVPIWFAWIATKQIGQNFRLAEDYGFKATVARAYEGYRKEAANINEDFASRLFESALVRLDEAPIRLVDPNIHGSPIQEFLQHPSIRDALSSNPDTKSEIISFLKSRIGAAAVGAAATTAASSPSPAKAEDEI